MSDASHTPVTVTPPQATEDMHQRQMVFLAYGLLLAGAFTGITALIAVIVAYVQKADAAGTAWHSHFRNIIVIFWVMLAVLALGTMMFPLALGFFFLRDLTFAWVSAISMPMLYWSIVVPVAAMWFLYRAIRGVIRTSENRAY